MLSLYTERKLEEFLPENRVIIITISGTVVIHIGLYSKLYSLS